MAYSTRNNISEQQHNNANPQTVTAQFADNRTSSATQLKQQTLMAASPTATAQRAAVNTMNTSAVQQQKIIQRAAPEEELQMKSIHSTTQLAGMDEEELLQGKFGTTQRAEDEELLQGKFETAQCAEDEELLQGKFETTQRAEDEDLLQGKFEPAQRAEKPNNTGLPDNLKSGIENLSGMSMDHVKVHYNSDKPAQLQAHAYAQGSEIHVAPGQEQHLPHEAWHVVQQAQGRVRPTVQMKGNVQVNDDVGLESEADLMGGRVAQFEGDQVIRNLVAEECAAGEMTQRIAIVGFSAATARIPIQMTPDHSEDEDEEMAVGGNYRRDLGGAVGMALGHSHHNQVTRESNVPSIMQNGLLTSHGGQNGAGAALGGQAGLDFQDRSRNFNHYSSDSGMGESAGQVFYRQLYESQGIPSQVVHMYLSRDATLRSENDPDDQGGNRFRTRQNVPPANLSLSPIVSSEQLNRAPAAASAIRSHLPPQHSGMRQEQLNRAMGDRPISIQSIADTHTIVELNEIENRLSRQSIHRLVSGNEVAELEEAIFHRSAFLRARDA